MNLFRILSSPGQDFRQLIEAAVLIITQQANPYQHLITSPGPFNYPPPSFLLYLPFAWVEMLSTQQISWYLWVFLSLLALFSGLWLLLKLVKKPSWINLLISIVLFWVLFFPTKFNLGMGQVNSFIFFFIVLGIYLGSPFFLALAAAIKLSPLVLVLFFFLRRDFKKTAWYIFWLIILFLLPFLFVSWDWQKQYYLHVFFNAFPLSGKEIYYNQSLLGFLTRSLANPTIIRIAQYSLSALLVLVTALRAKRLTNFQLWSALVSLVLILNPLAWQHHFILAAIPLILLPKSFLLVIAYLLTAANLATPSIIPQEFNFLLSHQFFGAFLLWLLAVFPKNTGKIIPFLWVILIMIAYILMLLCHAKICF